MGFGLHLATVDVGKQRRIGRCFSSRVRKQLLESKEGDDDMSHHYSGPDWGFPRGNPRLDLADLYTFPKPGDTDKSILIMNAHPSVRDYRDRENPLAPTTAEAFAAEALYEIKIDTDGDAVADIAYRVRFSSSAGGAQTATLRRVEGAEAAGADDRGQAIVEGAPVSTGRERRG